MREVSNSYPMPKVYDTSHLNLVSWLMGTLISLFLKQYFLNPFQLSVVNLATALSAPPQLSTVQFTEMDDHDSLYQSHIKEQGRYFHPPSFSGHQFLKRTDIQALTTELTLQYFIHEQLIPRPNLHSCFRTF